MSNWREAMFIPGYMINCELGQIVNMCRYKADGNFEPLKATKSKIKQGYYISLENKLHSKAKLIYEESIGLRLPPRCRFSFKDGDNMNCSINNIICKIPGIPGTVHEVNCVGKDDIKRKAIFSKC